MPETLDIAQLRTFVAVAECGGVSRAAVALHLSQPTVSQHVRNLERKLGRPLLEKQGRRVRFTAAGERLLVQARRVLHAHDRALASLDAVELAPLVLGVADTVAEELLPIVDGPLRRAFPDRAVRYAVDRSSIVGESVARGALDAAIILGVGGDLPGRQLAVLPLDWYSAPDRALAEAEAVPLIAYAEPCGIRQRAMQQLGAFGRDADVVVDAGGLDGIVAAARVGLGVAALPSLRRRADGVLAGLVVRDDLPGLGSVNVRLVVRRGGDDDVEELLLEALEAAFPVPRRILG